MVGCPHIGLQVQLFLLPQSPSPYFHNRNLTVTS